MQIVTMQYYDTTCIYNTLNYKIYNKNISYLNLYTLIFKIESLHIRIQVSKGSIIYFKGFRYFLNFNRNNL